MKQKTHLTHVHTTPTAITIQNLKLNLPALDQNENPCQVKNKIPRLGSNKPNDFNQNYHGTFSKRVPLCSSEKSRTAHGNAALVSLHRDSPRPRPSRALSFSRCKMKRCRPGPRTVRTHETAAGQESLHRGRKAGLSPFAVAIFVTKQKVRHTWCQQSQTLKTKNCNEEILAILLQMAPLRRTVS